MVAEADVDDVVTTGTVVTVGPILWSCEVVVEKDDVVVVGVEVSKLLVDAIDVEETVI